ncbi:MAG: hypothetical protein IKW65_02510 [Bacteroidales bacterium]|nr:hypothetical protein [Bacteroidales bacterium]
MKRIFVIAAFIIAAVFCAKSAFAEGGDDAGKKAVMSFVDKYSNVEGFDANTFVKGEGLGFVKSQLNGQFGRKFMKGVTIITMAEYAKVSPEICDLIHEDYNLFFSEFEEVELPKAKKSEDENGALVRSFLRVNKEESVITDFITIVEENEAKVLFYMGGKISLEDFESLVNKDEE